MLKGIYITVEFGNGTSEKQVSGEIHFYKNKNSRFSIPLHLAIQGGKPYLKQLHLW